MELDYLYNIAEKENINLYNNKIDNIKGAFINIKDTNNIVMNYSIIDTYAEEKCVVAEELGHYFMDAFYSPYEQNKQEIERQEYRAKKWSYNVLIPYEDLKLAILKRKQHNL